MSYEYVYTYGDIIVSNYTFNKILELKITRNMNEHASLYLKGIIDYEDGDSYVENANDKSYIKVSIKDDKENVRDLFYGIIVNISIASNNGIKTLEIQSLSETFLLDTKRKKRTFQDENETYANVIESVNADYDNCIMSDNATNDKEIDKFLVQYEETDWEFIKRLASHFNAPIFPECTLDGIKYYIGNANKMTEYSLEEFNYSVIKDIGDFKNKFENGLSELDDMNSIKYEFYTNRIFDLCDIIKFNGKSLYVCSVVIEMTDSEIINKYVLCDAQGIKVKKIYNNKIVGMSLKGKIANTKNDVVQVNLDIDSNRQSSHRWFPYSTVYSSEDGTGWYCMPENGDAIRLYFPDNVEKNAYVISSVDLKSRDTAKRSDPSVKSIGTKYGKQLVMEPGCVSIIAGSGMSVKMNDGGGIVIKSDKKIILDAQDDIEINGKAKVSISGDSGVDLKQNSANLSILDDVTLTGGKVKIE